MAQIAAVVTLKSGAASIRVRVLIKLNQVDNAASANPGLANVVCSVAIIYTKIQPNSKLEKENVSPVEQQNYMTGLPVR